MTKFLNPKDEEDWSKERIQKEDKELEYILRTKNSRKLYERAKRVIPAGVTREFRFFEPYPCLLYTSPSPRDRTRSRMPSSA